jgi:hypothetical protein
MYKNDRFAKTGSGQTWKTQNKCRLQLVGGIQMAIVLNSKKTRVEDRRLN